MKKLVPYGIFFDDILISVKNRKKPYNSNLPNPKPVDNPKTNFSGKTKNHGIYGD